ncbi:trypsin-like peptidase domain-containing protein [Candidatus Woesearchaeota archaeon]|nr:trypsin-like peptidase domain-containing protein [Candidatus Woesearchaeota archaeon]
MPISGQFKKAFFSLIVGGAVIYGGYKINSIERRVEQVQSVSRVDDGRIVSLEDSVEDLSKKHNKDGVRMAIDATLRVHLFSDDVFLGNGSGVVVYSEKNKNDNFDNYLLTAAHVVMNDSPDKSPNSKFIIMLDQYVGLVPYLSFIGYVRASNETADLAVVYFESSEKLPVVRIASETNIAGIQTADDVYTVGCPLDEPPLRTCGELFAKNRGGDNKTFWTLTTPVVFGNSGGGVFDSKDELVGIIVQGGTLEYRVGSTFVFEIPTSHPAFMSHLLGFQDWLEKENLGFLLRKE